MPDWLLTILLSALSGAGVSGVAWKAARWALKDDYVLRTEATRDLSEIRAEQGRARRGRQKIRQTLTKHSRLHQQHESTIQSHWERLREDVVEPLKALLEEIKQMRLREERRDANLQHLVERLDRMEGHPPDPRVRGIPFFPKQQEEEAG